VIQIDEPPAAPFCASCNEQVVWLYSASKEAWVAFVPCTCGERFALRPHPCRHAQHGPTWRSLPHGDPPSAEYLQVKQKIASKETT
jgi:predicted RNA-binding Zn-ribbon protein involved in translation (DUF1610 family)